MPRLARNVVLFLLLSMGSAGTAAQSVAARAAGVPGESGGLGAGTLLVAGRGLNDANFSATVVLLLEYGARGAIGTIINRATDIPVASVLPDIPELRGRDERVHMGGPVQLGTMRILVRSAEQLEPANRVLQDVYYVDDLDLLRRLAGDPHLPLRFYAGYAGWGPGQLEDELLRGDWLTTPGDARLVFSDTPDALWPELIKRLSGLWTAR